MKNCGKRFHNEVGKFRFLNELIKVVSPKVKIPLFAVVTLLWLQLCTHKNCGVVDVSTHLQPTFL